MSTVPSCVVMRQESSPGSNKIPSDSVVMPVLKPTQTNIESSADLAESALLQCGLQIGPDGKVRHNVSLNIKCSASSIFPSSEESSAFNTKPHEKSYLTSTVSSNQSALKTVKDSQTPTSSIPTAKIGLEADSAPKVQSALSPHKKSRFTWVKNQGTETSQTKSDIQHLSTSSDSVPTASPVVAKQTQTSSKKHHCKLSFSPGTRKTSKYSWVSSSSSPKEAAKSALTNPPHKLLPKALNDPGKSHGRYHWKAVAASSTVSAHVSTPRSSRKFSLYRWTAQKDERDSASRVQHLSCSGFKLRSRTKIIRPYSNR